VAEVPRLAGLVSRHGRGYADLRIGEGASRHARYVKSANRASMNAKCGGSAIWIDYTMWRSTGHAIAALLPTCAASQRKSVSIGRMIAHSPAPPG
jgi:hypothetical protein